MGSILIDNKDADASLQKTEGKADGFFKKLGGGIKTVAKVGAAIGGMAIAGGASLFGMASKSAEATDRIDKMSQRLGLSRKGFQELDFVLSQSGVSIDSFQTGMKTLLARMDGVAKGNETAIENFEKLGVSAVDSSGKMRNQEDVLKDTIIAFQKMEDSSEKSRLAQELFGKQGQEILPLLNDSAGGYEELAKKANDLGIVLGDDAIDAGVQFTDTIDQMKRSLGAMGTEIGVAVMPIVQQAADWVIAHMPQIREVVGVVFKAIGDFVKIAVDIFKNYFVPAISFVIDWVKANWPTIQAVIKTVMDTVKSIIETVTGLIKTIWDKWGDQIMATLKTVWDIVKNVVETTINVVKGIIETVTALIKGDWEGVWNGIKAIFTSIWDGIKGHVDTVINAIKGIIKNVTDSIKTTWSNVWNGIKDTTTKVWDGIKSAIMTPIEWVRDKVKGVIDTIKGFFNFNISWPHIPMPHFGITPSGWKIGDLLKGSIPRLGISWYADGAIFDKPTLFNTPYGLKGVGEAGPEVVAPLSRLQSMLDFNNNADLLAEVIELLKEIRDKNQDLYLDGERLVGYLIDYVDERLGEKQRQNELAFGGA